MQKKSSDNVISSRRNFFSKALSAVSSAAILSRLSSVGGITALGMTTTGCMGETTYDQGEDKAFEPFWAYRADRLEEYQKNEFEVDIRTSNAPGPHNGPVHAPIVTLDQGVITAKVDHVMALDHWITTMYIRDIDTGRVIYLKEFHPTEVDEGAEKGATITATLPNETFRFAVFSFCNKHELWMSDIIDLS